MKNTISFRLTDEAKNILERKARILSLNKTAVLEAMIQEFSPSTREEKLQQIKDRNKAFNSFLNPESKSSTFFVKKTKTNEKIWKIWINGYLNGWMQFQVRKTTSLFRVSKVSQSLMAK